MKIKTNDYQTSVFTDDGRPIDYVRKVTFTHGADFFPKLEVEAYLMSDQEFEVLNEHCHITVTGPTLQHFPSQLLLKELEGRGYKLSK